MYHTAGKSLYSFRGYHSMLILRRWMARTVYPVWIMCGIMNIMYAVFFQISLVWLAVVIRFVVRENTHMLNWFVTCSIWVGGVWCWATGLSAMPFEVDSIIVDMYNRRLPSYLVWCITILFLTNVNSCCNDSCLLSFSTCLSTTDSSCFKYKCSSLSLESESFFTGRIWCPIDIKNRKVMMSDISGQNNQVW